jgi:N utilization substance protein A
LSAIEAALVSAYRKDGVADGQNISVKLEPGSGEITVFVLMSVVDEVTDPETEMTLAEARKLKPDVEVGDSIATDEIPHSAGRIAAQTAKQVVMQRLREAERELVYEEYVDREGEVLAINVQRVEPRQTIVDLGRAEAVMPVAEQVPYERYRSGQKMRVLLKSVQRSAKGPELIVSRADNLFLKRLFEMEVPEIYNGAVEITAIAREPGSRSKVAVRARQAGVDPVGSCVGLRGVRIQNIVNELWGEKIDVVEWSKEPAKYVANALSPSQVLRVDLDEEANAAVAVVPDRQLSLAIGREGQNARLAAKLTGWSVDIKSNVEADKGAEERKAAAAAREPVTVESGLERIGFATRALNVLKAAGVSTVSDVLAKSESELLEVKGFGAKSYSELMARLDKLGLLRVEPEPQAEEPEVEAPAAEEVVIEEPAAVDKEAEAPPEVAQEPVAVEEEVPVAEAVEETAAEVEQAPEEVPPPVPEPEPAVPVPALARSGSLRDVSDDVWTIRRAPSAGEPGQIRFAEDIVGLRGGVTASRGRRGGGGGQNQARRRPKASRRRRFR